MQEFAGKILMISESSFPEDPRVRNEAFTLSKEGYKIIFIARNNGEKKFRENINGVSVYRIPHISLFKKSTSSKTAMGIWLFRFTSAVGYMFEYFYFTLASLVLSLYIVLKENFNFIHIHNPPNTLFIIGLIFRIFGKKYVFDHHDLAPELYLSKYKIQSDLVYKILLAEESLSLKLANLVIATNESYKKIDIKRGRLKQDKVFVVRNGPDLENFRLVAPDFELKNMGKTILAYVGVMGPQDGIDYLLRALHYMVYSIKRYDFFCIIIGSGDAIEDLKLMSKDLKIEDYIRFTGYIPHGDLLRYLSTADICLDPNPSNPLNDSSTWIKVMEYMALGKPIVSFDLKETRFSAQTAAVYVPPNDEKKYAKSIVQLMEDPDKRAKMGEFGRARILNELAWQHVSKNLLRAYRSFKTK